MPLLKEHEPFVKNLSEIFAALFSSHKCALQREKLDGKGIELYGDLFDTGCKPDGYMNLGNFHFVNSGQRERCIFQ